MVTCPAVSVAAERTTTVCECLFFPLSLDFDWNSGWTTLQKRLLSAVSNQFPDGLSVTIDNVEALLGLILSQHEHYLTKSL